MQLAFQEFTVRVYHEPGQHLMNFYFSQHHLRAVIGVKKHLHMVCIGYLSVGLQIICRPTEYFAAVLKARNPAAGDVKFRRLLGLRVVSL